MLELVPRSDRQGRNSRDFAELLQHTLDGDEKEQNAERIARKALSPFWRVMLNKEVLIARKTSQVVWLIIGNCLDLRIVHLYLWFQL